MIGVIFRETLRRNWRGSLILGGLLAAMAFYIVATLSDSNMVELMKAKVTSLAFLVNTLGGGDAEFMASPIGIINIGYFTWMILVLGGYAIYYGVNITVMEEDRGIMDMVLATPVTRGQIIIEKFIAYALLLAFAIFIGNAALLVFTSQFEAFSRVDTARVSEGSFNLLPTSLLLMGVTTALGVIFRRRGATIGLASGFLFASFVVDMLGRNLPDATGLRAVSFFTYYDSAAVLQHGLVWANVFLLVALALLCVVVALWRWQRRDVGV
ncbi:MAG: hypothetical protein OHK0023_16580 [Anaerolineae bacterium]